MDNVNRPEHYQLANGRQVIDIIDELVDDAPSYYLGNVIKYVSRHKKKNGLEDLKKARWYLDRMIGELENED